MFSSLLDSMSPCASLRPAVPCSLAPPPLAGQIGAHVDLDETREPLSDEAEAAAVAEAAATLPPLATSGDGDSAEHALSAPARPRKMTRSLRRDADGNLWACAMKVGMTMPPLVMFEGKSGGEEERVGRGGGGKRS